MIGIRLVALGGTPIPGEPWLKHYDPEADNGIGRIMVTTDPHEALSFYDIAQAWDCYHRVPECRPLRPDGRLNKPLVAYSITIQEIPGK